MSLWNLKQGDGPVIVDVPHAGVEIPAAIAARLTREALARPDTDWHVEKLYDFAVSSTRRSCARRIRATWSTSIAIRRAGCCTRRRQHGSLSNADVRQ